MTTALPPTGGSGPQAGPARPHWERCRFCGAQFKDTTEAMMHVCRRDAPADPFKAVDLTDRFLRLVYRHNPFYVISAGLLLLGLSAAFGASADPGAAWRLMAVLSGYTLLLAGTAMLIVRLGGVWEDARSLLLVVVLLFLALSVSFDEVLIRAPWTGRGLLALGFAGSVAVSELLLLVLRIRLREWFRIPYYALLALFFAYPVALQRVLGTTDIDQIPGQWGIFLFPAVAGLFLLLLLPAIRCGRDYADNNGTPWRWPWFPWTLFAFLAFGICARSYYFTLSFHAARGFESIFGLYFLMPVAVAAAVLLLEIGIVAGKRGVLVAAVLLPLIGILMSIIDIGPTGTYDQFLMMYKGMFGPPAFTAAVTATLFCLYACLRRVWLAMPALVVALMAGAASLPAPLGGRTTAIPEIAPFLLAAVVFTWLAFIKRHSLLTLAAAFFFITTAAVALRDTWFVRAHGAIPLHLAYLALLLIAALFRDRAALFLRRAAALVLPLLVIGDLAARRSVAEAAGFAAAPWIYLAAALALPFLYGCWVCNFAWLIVGVCDALVAACWGGGLACVGIQAAYGSDVAWSAAGAALAFVLALAISLTKMPGLIRKAGSPIIGLYRPRATDAAG